MVAIWSVDDGQLNFSMVTNDFPRQDFVAAEEQFKESVNDFLLHTIGTSENVIAAAPKLTDEEMLARPSGVVSKDQNKELGDNGA